MKHQASPTDFSERRLDKASKHVTNLWFPINPTTLGDLRKRLERGASDANTDAVLEILKQDFALFTFIVKELMPIGQQERLAPEIVNNPIELIRWAGLERIKVIVSDDRNLPSAHVFQTLEPFQADRLRETAIIASTAEVLSEKHNLDPDTGYCRGVVREIGLNLIAWNYPSLYARVIKNLSGSKTLDEELTEALGFSPSLLAMRILGPKNDQTEVKSMKQTWATYDRLCEVGEALARAENPETYPSAENDWKLASAYLEKTVGSQAIDLIKNRAHEHSERYQETLAASFKSITEFNPEQNVQHFKRREKSRKNRYLQHCPLEVQDALRELYAAMTNLQELRGVLDHLFRVIIPNAGFTGGCVYIVDPSAFALMPRTVFGSVRLRTIEQVALRHSLENQQEVQRLGVLVSKPTFEIDSAATALSCSQPVVERHNDYGDTPMTGMYGSLGDTRKIGVLYLEVPDGSNVTDDSKSLGTFKAMRQALSDALRLD